ncbi:hypothetical protein D3C80_269960 [compost metagenome]
MQAQGHIGVFRGVGAGLFKADLVEGQLFGAFASNVGETDGGVVQVLERQAVHVVTGRRRIEHIGLQHGVIGHALHQDAIGDITADGAVGEDVHVVLGVLPDFELLRIFEQRFKRQQYTVAIQLLGRPHVAVRQRHIGGLMGLHSERQANQLRLLRIQASGLGVEGE